MTSRMHLVKDTLKFMVNQLKSTDRLGIVAYDQEVDTLLPLTNMDNEGKEIASHAIQKLSIGGQTNTSGGLLRGLDMVHRRTQYELYFKLAPHYLGEVTFAQFCSLQTDWQIWD